MTNQDQAMILEKIAILKQNNKRLQDRLIFLQEQVQCEQEANRRLREKLGRIHQVLESET